MTTSKADFPAWAKDTPGQTADHMRQAIRYAIGPGFPDDEARITWLRAWWAGDLLRQRTAAEWSRLESIASVFDYWREFNTRDRAKEGLDTSPDTHLVCCPPEWPRHGVLERWSLDLREADAELAALRRERDELRGERNRMHMALTNAQTEIDEANERLAKKDAALREAIEEYRDVNPHAILMLQRWREALAIHPETADAGACEYCGGDCTQGGALICPRISPAQCQTCGVPGPSTCTCGAAPAPAPAISGDPLADLMQRFAAALLEKARAAEAKYGWNNAWMREGWADDLRHHLRQHVEKGDPRDVAIYAAFAWHHGYSLAASAPAISGGEIVSVPREPTEAMLAAVDCAGEKRNWLSGKAWVAGYRAMIDAHLAAAGQKP